MTRCNTSARCSHNLYRNGCFNGSGIVVRRCRKRSALPHSRVMIHQPSGGAQGVLLIWKSTCEKCWKKDELTISFHSTLDKLWQSTQRPSVIIGWKLMRRKRRNDWWSIEKKLKNSYKFGFKFKVVMVTLNFKRLNFKTKMMRKKN
jgi:hypothetical protein